jgi:ankyrin repeat protein
MAIVNKKRKWNFGFYLSTLLGFLIIYLAIQSATLPFELKLWIYLLGLIVIVSNPFYQYLLWMGRKNEERLQFSDNLPLLMQSAWTGDLDQLLLHLQSNIQIDSRDEHGASALMYASAANQAKIVEELLKRGAKKNLKTHKGNTAMFFAIQEKHNEIITLLSN